MKLMRLGALGYALISIYLWPSKVVAAIINATIDDQLGDSVTHRLVNYYPSQNVWDDQHQENVPLYFDYFHFEYGTFE